MKAPAIRGVFFDVGGTLIYPWPSVGAVYARLGQRFGFQFTAEAMDAAFRTAWKTAKTEAPGRMTTADKEWWRMLVFRALTILKIEATEQVRQVYFEDLYAAFVEPEAWRIFPDVIPTLQALRNYPVHVGIISNWDERLRPLLERLELTQYFDSITISCEAGAEKPDAAIFKAALEKAGIAPEQAIHLGDSESEDGRGASAAGVHFIPVRQSDDLAVSGLEQVIGRLG